MKGKQSIVYGTNSLTTDELIRLELDGKNQAIAKYDSILWKTRTGYAIVLYGALSLIVSMFSSKDVTWGTQIGFVLGLLIVGFSLFALLLATIFFRSSQEFVGKY